MWAAIKAAFAALPAERKAEYENASSLTKTIAEANRLRQRNAIAAAAVPSPGPSPLAFQLGPEPAPSLPRGRLAVASASDWLVHSDGPGVPVLALGDGNGCPGAPPPPSAVIPERAAQRSQQSRSEAVPLTGKQLAHLMKEFPVGTRAAPGGVRGACATFGKTLSLQPKPPHPGWRFPEKVKYATECGIWCENSTPRRVLEFHSHVLHRLTHLSCKVMSTPAVVSQKVAMFQALVSDRPEEPEMVTRFVAVLASALGAHGRFPAEQNFLHCDVARPGPGDSLEGAQVTLRRVHFVPHARMLEDPLRNQARGTFAFVDEQEFAKELFTSIQGDRAVHDYILPCILIARLRYTRLTADEFRIEGVGESFEAIAVSSSILSKESESKFKRGVAVKRTTMTGLCSTAPMVVSTPAGPDHPPLHLTCWLMHPAPSTTAPRARMPPAPLMLRV